MPEPSSSLRGSRWEPSQTTPAVLAACADLPNPTQNPPLTNAYVQILCAWGRQGPWLHVLRGQLGQAAVPARRQGLAAGSTCSFCSPPSSFLFNCKGALTKLVPWGSRGCLSCCWAIMVWFLGESDREKEMAECLLMLFPVWHAPQADTAAPLGLNHQQR